MTDTKLRETVAGRLPTFAEFYKNPTNVVIPSWFDLLKVADDILDHIKRAGYRIENIDKTAPGGSGHPAEEEPLMSNDEQAIEKEIQAKGLNAPRLNPDMIDATIKSEAYYVFPGTTLTVCMLTLQNGFNVIGESAAASPENFDEAIGRQIARTNARGKIWALEGYRLKSKLAAA